MSSFRTKELDQAFEALSRLNDDELAHFMHILGIPLEELEGLKAKIKRYLEHARREEA